MPKLFATVTVLLCLILPSLAAGYIGIKHYYNEVEFRHYIHTDGQGIACQDCHDEIKKGVYALPDHQVCVSCHAEHIDVDDLNEKTCGFCHSGFEKKDDGTITLTIKPQRPRGDIFTHTPALKYLCHNCHGAMLNDLVEAGRIRTPKERARIREISHRFYFAPKCASCHEEGFSVDKAPENHAKNWDDEHQKVAPGFNCRICHTKNFCQDCHDATY